MKKLLLFLLFNLFLFSASNSLIVKVDIKEACFVEIKSLSVSLENFPKLEAEIYNSGSLPYSFRILIEGENRVWSRKIFEVPGDLKKIRLYFLPSNETKMKIYFCNRIFEKSLDVKEKSFQKGDWFFVKKARVYSNFISLEILSNVSSDVVVIPLYYPENLIIENYEGRFKTGKNYVRVNFEGEIMGERNISFVIASTDGKYISASEVRLERKQGIEYWFFYIYDTIRWKFNI
jgi:hypothetical protein